MGPGWDFHIPLTGKKRKSKFTTNFLGQQFVSRIFFILGYFDTELCLVLYNIMVGAFLVRDMYEYRNSCCWLAPHLTCWACPYIQITEMAEAGKSDLLELTNEQLNHYAAGFSEEHFLGQTMFGMLYRGKIINVPEVGQTKEVIVKIWKNQKSLYIDGIDKRSRLKVCFLISYCCPFSLCSLFF